MSIYERKHAKSLESLKPLKNETINAYQAFCDYVEMGHKRSISKLVEKYQSRTEAIPTRQVSRLKIWSKKYEWRRRITEYQAAYTQQSQQAHIEAYDSHIEKAIEMAEDLLEHLRQMINDFQTLRITRRQIVDDPRDIDLPASERRQMERIYMKINVKELHTLIMAFGTLNKDLRTVLGIPIMMDIGSVENTVVKTYVGVSPDDWDNEPIAKL